jgi:hypothetical protein
MQVLVLPLYEVNMVTDSPPERLFSLDAARIISVSLLSFSRWLDFAPFFEFVIAAGPRPRSAW